MPATSFRFRIPSLMWASGSKRTEGSLPWHAKHRAATLYSVGPFRGPDHEAVIGFSSEAPRRRAHSGGRRRGRGSGRVAATSDHDRRPIMPTAWWTPKSECLRVFLRRRSCRLPQHDALRDFAGIDHAPERDEELPRECDDHRPLVCALGAFDAASEPLRQSTVFLEVEEAPGELDHAAADPRIAGLGESLLPAFRAAFIRRACEASAACDSPAVAQVARQYFMDQHVGRLDADADDTGQH